jgi:hypothetical protein
MEHTRVDVQIARNKTTLATAELKPHNSLEKLKDSWFGFQP